MRVAYQFKKMGGRICQVFNSRSKGGGIMSGTGRVSSFVDWENIRQRLADNYAEKIGISEVLTAIEKVVNEIGQLQLCQVFGDWSMRSEEAHIIQQKPKFKPFMVLRSGRKDQTDPAMIAEILETYFNISTNGISEILVCSGDSNYADVIRRGFARDIKMHVCAVGIDVAKELTALAPFYPLERYLEKLPSPKRLVSATLPGMLGVDPGLVKLIDVLNSVEQRLPYVSYTYFRGKIMPMYPLLQQGAESLLREAERQGIIEIMQRENPVNPGSLFRCLCLKRDSDIVKTTLVPPQK